MINNDFLLNKNILFICRKYFGYEKEIISTLEILGANVDHLIDVPFDSTLLKAIIRVIPNIANNRAASIYKKQLRNLGINNYDFIFIIIGETISERFLNSLKKNNPDAKLILFIWDSIKNNRRNLVPKFKIYDKVLSFQKEDAKKYNILFSPLFFITSFSAIERQIPEDFEFDLSFFGTAHADRPKIVQNLIQNLPSIVKFHSYLFLHSRWLFRLYKLIYSPYFGIKEENINYQRVTKDYIAEVYSKSKAVLDIQHPKQTGLTIRTFEVLASGRKLITTNSDIVNYEFYSADRILIIDRKNPIISTDFLFKEIAPISNEFLEKYSLKSWLFEVLK